MHAIEAIKARYGEEIKARYGRVTNRAAVRYALHQLNTGWTEGGFLAVQIWSQNAEKAALERDAGSSEGDGGN